MTDYRIVPVEPTEEMLRRALAIDWPATYREHLRHPESGPTHRAETEQRIDREKRRYAAMLSAAPAVDRQAVVETIKLNPAFMAEVMDEQQDWLAGVLADAILALFGEGE